ncbi:MAG: UDP-N-acetylmuramate--L-alanine ligase, partial [Chloroflexi bacterium]|nr:UDP-N-acetylmuramate--L-alanine ligase [Chloroflexota bacterium]
MSAIAQVLLEEGRQVSGSDLAASPVTEELAEKGARIHMGHDPKNVRGADLLIASAAVAPANPEVQEAKRLGIPVLDRRQFFREWTAQYEVIAVAGTHGKTTTSAMVALVLERAGLNPTYILGGKIRGGKSAHKGQGKQLVIEADEYQRAFLGLRP